VVLLGDAARDGEAEAVAGFDGVEPNEALEDAIALMFGYSGAVVDDVRFDVSVAALELHLDYAGGLDGGEGVVDEVADNSFERVGVAADGGVVSGVERNGRSGRACAGVFEERPCDGSEIGSLTDWACFEAGESEEVVHEAAYSFALAGDDCFEAVALGPFRLLAQEGLDARLQCSNGGAELV
jgi:hypothetical protein